MSIGVLFTPAFDQGNVEQITKAARTSNAVPCSFPKRCNTKRWLSERRFLHALNYCMLLPGHEAQQLATYIGWLMHRTWGGVIAGGLFVLPSLLILIGLS